MSAATLLLPANPRERGYPKLNGDVIAMHERIADIVIGEWKGLVDAAIREDKVELLFASREEFRKYFDAWSEQLDDFFKLCRRTFPNDHEYELGVLASLQMNRDRLDDFYVRLFPRWTSLDDFSILLNEEMTIPEVRLAALVRTHPPSHTWYDGDEEKPW